jgi:hypothetical protein
MLNKVRESGEIAIGDTGASFQTVSCNGEMMIEYFSPECNRLDRPKLALDDDSITPSEDDSEEGDEIIDMSETIGEIIDIFDVELNNLDMNDIHTIFIDTLESYTILMYLVHKFAHLKIAYFDTSYSEYIMFDSTKPSPTVVETPVYLTIR